MAENNIDWRGWIITEEQAKAIKNKDMKACEKFYFDNLERIKSMAYKYVKKRHLADAGKQYDYDDCINGLFVDLPVLGYKNGRDISNSIIHSFYYSIYGGWLYIRENNTKLENADYRQDVFTYLDDISYGKNFDRKEKADRAFINVVKHVPSVEETLFNYCLTSEEIGKTFVDCLSPREYEIALLYLDGIGVSTIPELLGLKNVTKQYAALKAHLRINYKAILKKLRKIGVNISKYKNDIPINFVESIKFFEKRRLANKKCRERAKERKKITKTA